MGKTFDGAAIRRANERAEAARFARHAPWTPDDVERDLLLAFEFDRRAKGIERPKAPGNSHPTTKYSADDLRDQTAVPLDPKRFPLTRGERKQMDETFGWLNKAEWQPADELHRMALLEWLRAVSAGHGRVKALCAKTGILRSLLHLLMRRPWRGWPPQSKRLAC